VNTNYISFIFLIIQSIETFKYYYVLYIIMTSKKEEIIKWLNEFNKLPSSRFVGLLGLEYNKVIKLLEELESENKIERAEETLATYWKIKNGD